MQRLLAVDRVEREERGGAVLIGEGFGASLGDTCVLATVVGDEGPGRDRDFFPLTVDYQEKTYAAGKIPGGFFKREGRPSEKEVLTSRLIDRPVRPLFPKGYRNEVQVIATVMSLDPEIDPDIPALIGASAALAISGMPFQGPIGAARVGYRDGKFLLNPTFTELQASDLDLVVAGTRTAVLMVESEAKGLPENVMLDAVMFGHEQMQPVIAAINELAQEAGRPAWEWEQAPKDMELAARAEVLGVDRISEAYRIVDKLARQSRLRELRAEIVEELTEGEESLWKPEAVFEAVESLEKLIVR